MAIYVRQAARGSSTPSRATGGPSSRRLAGRIVLVLVVVSCGAGGDGDADDSSIEVSREDFGADWPLTVASGILACEGAGAVTFTANGTTYAVNGMASSLDAGVDIDPIWAEARDAPKKNIGPLIDRGLELCEL